MNNTAMNTSPIITTSFMTSTMMNTMMNMNPTTTTMQNMNEMTNMVCFYFYDCIKIMLARLFLVFSSWFKRNCPILHMGYHKYYWHAFLNFFLFNPINLN